MNDSWGMCADLLEYGFLEEASAGSITLRNQEVETKVKFDKGKTQECYDYLARRLTTDEEKAELALAVLESKSYCMSFMDWIELKKFFWSEVDDYQVKILKLIDKVGFDAAADEIEEWWWTKYRPNHPEPALLFGVRHPTWNDCGKLSFGNHSWKFRRIPDGPLMAFLNEFEKRNWPVSVTLKGDFWGQVVGVARELRQKTKEYIWWTASIRSNTLSWHLVEK